MSVKLSHILSALSQAADLAEAKDLGHGQRVAILALHITEAIGALDPEARADLCVAALLHDLAIPAVVYDLYAGSATPERTLLADYPSYQSGAFAPDHQADLLAPRIAGHAEIGARTLRQLGYADQAADILAWHHHTWEQLQNQPSTNVTLGAQILALADLLETATRAFDTVEERRHLATQVVERIPPHLVQPELVAAAMLPLSHIDTWEAVFFLDRIEEKLDTCLRARYPENITWEALEAHLQVLADFVDAQSPYMAGHSRAVARLARHIGERIGLAPQQLDSLHLAALVHGVGRLALPCAILDKKGGLSGDEFAQLHAYPSLTREVFAPLRDLAAIVDDASTHREKLDGSGYPEGRIGEHIPLFGRILAVADTFVALIADRPYRPAHSRSRAIAIIQAESARLFDGLVTDALEAVYREGY